MKSFCPLYSSNVFVMDFFFFFFFSLLFEVKKRKKNEIFFFAFLSERVLTSTLKEQPKGEK